MPSLLSATIALILIGCTASDDSVETRNIEVLHVAHAEIWSKGNRIEISEVSIYKLSDGKIAEQWVFPDMRSMQQQLDQRE